MADPDGSDEIATIGYGEGITYLATVTADGTGYWSATGLTLTVGSEVSAIALVDTDADLTADSTSEFAANFTVASGIGNAYAVAASSLQSGGNSQLTRIDEADADPATNEILIGNGAGVSGIEGLSRSPVDGQLYAARNAELGVIDSATGSYTPVGPFGSGSGAFGLVAMNDVQAIAFDPATGQLFGVHRRTAGGADLLFEIDPATGSIVADAFGVDEYVAIQIQATRHDVTSLAIDPADGTAYAMMFESTNYRLVTIDLTDGSTGNNGDITDFVAGFSFDDLGRLWAVGTDTSNDYLYRLDKNDGSNVLSQYQIDNADDYRALALPPPVLFTISGSVFNDGLGMANPADFSGQPNVNIRVYQDNAPVGTRDASDTQLVVKQTGPGGDFAIPVTAGNAYWVVAQTDGSGAWPTDIWPEQTYGSTGSLCDDGGAGVITRASDGPCYGGISGDVSDAASAGLLSSEHVIHIPAVSGAVTGVEFAFATNVVTNTRAGDFADDDPAFIDRTVQGSLRQFITNANNRVGADMMRFVPVSPTNASGNGQTWWTIPVTNQLPPISGAFTTIDGTAYDHTDGTTALTTNTAALGYVGPVGTGADAIPGNGDDPTLAGLDGPELEIVGDGSVEGITVAAGGDDSEIRDLSVWGFLIDVVSRDADRVDVIDNVLGSGPSAFVDPGVTRTANRNGSVYNGSDWTWSGNLLGFSSGTSMGIYDPTTTGWTFSGNEFKSAGLTNLTADALSIHNNTTGGTIANNLIAGSAGHGVDLRQSGDGHLIENNTLTGNGHGNGTPTQTSAIRVQSDGHTIRHNVITGQVGAGITVAGLEAADAAWTPSINNVISRNSFSGNGSNAIDLNKSGSDSQVGDGVTPNGTYGPDAGNLGLDAPSITLATVAAVTGTACANCTVEAYRVANGAGDATNGEGDLFVGTGSADGAGNFSFAVSGLVAGDDVSAIAIDASGNTSEFGENLVVLAGTETISGTVFEDIDGDALEIGALSDASNPGVGDVTVNLYRDGGDGQPDGVDDVFVTSTTTSNVPATLGQFSFTSLPTTLFWVTVDSTTIAPTAGTQNPIGNPYLATLPGSDDVWADQTYGPIGSVTESGAVYAYKASAGPAFAGKTPTGVDGAGLSGAEHVVKVDFGAGDTGAQIDLGFSFNVVTHMEGGDTTDLDPSDRVYQGSFRQFLHNSNAIVGRNAMRFVPTVPTNASAGANTWWMLTVTDRLSLNRDVETILDGTAYDASSPLTVLDPNTASVGTGGTTGVSGAVATAVLNPEFEIRGDGVVSTGISLDPGAHDSAIRNFAVTNFPSHGIVVIGPAATPIANPVVVGNVVGVAAGDFTDNPALRVGTNPILLDRTTDATLTDNVVAYTTSSGLRVRSSARALVARNEVREVGVYGITIDEAFGVDAGNVTVTNNHIVDSGFTGVDTRDTFGFHTITDNTIEGSGVLSGANDAGIRLGPSDNTVTLNVVSGNGGSAISIAGDGSASINNLISQNVFGANGGIAVDLNESGAPTWSGDGHTPNDGGTDPTTGNNGLDYPIVLVADAETGTVSGTACATCAIEIYLAVADGDGSDDDASSVGHGEGITYLTTVPQDGSPTWSATGLPITAGQVVSAIAIETTNDTSEFGPNAVVTDGTASIDGTVYADWVGDGSIVADPQILGVDVELFLDDGDNLPNAADVSVGTTTTDGTNPFSFSGLAAGTYWVGVDSRFSANWWYEQTYGPAGGWCDTPTGASTERGTAGPCYGGLNHDRSDDLANLGLPGAEHIARIVVAPGEAKANIDFGFSVHVVTTTRGGDLTDDDPTAPARTIQGSLRQFITNARNVPGANAMRFVPVEATNASDGAGNDWWRIGVTDAFDSINAADTTLSGIAHSYLTGLPTIDTNTAAIGAGASVGYPASGTTAVLDPELEIRNIGATSDGIYIVAGGDRTIIEHLAITGFTSDGIRMFGGTVSPPDGVVIRNNVLGSSPASFTDDPATANGSTNISISFSTGLQITDNLIGYGSSWGNVVIDSSTGGLIARNEILDGNTGVWLFDNYAAVGAFGSSDFTVQHNLIKNNGWIGVRLERSGGSISVIDNTITGNSVAGVKVDADNNLVSRNEITGSAGPGIMVAATTDASQNVLSQNSIHSNSGTGIDLAPDGTFAGDGVDPNDALYPVGTHANDGLDKPVIQTAEISGANLILTGFVGKDASRLADTYTLEVFQVDMAGDTGTGDDGLIEDTDIVNVRHGEGRWYLGSCAIDTTVGPNEFSCSVPIGTLVAGDYVTATVTTTTAPATSEFGPNAYVNNPPTFDSDLPDRSDPEGAVISLPASASDPDPDTLLYGATGLPPGLSINTSSGLISGTITYTATGSYAVTLTVDDGNGGSDIDTFTWTVTEVNRPPVATDATFSIDEDALDNDPVGTVSASDPDAGDTLSYAITSGDPGGSFDIDASGNITVVAPPGLDYETTTTFNLVVTVTDDGAPNLDDTAAITVNIGPINDNTPVANDDSGYTVLEGGSLDTSVSGDNPVLFNDTDADVPADSLTASLVSGPSQDTAFTLNPDGSFTYTHNGSETVTDTFTYTTSDGTNTSAAATVTITITPVNDPPTAVDDPGVGVNEGAAVVIPVLANDTDPDDGIDVTSVVATNGTFGTTSVNATTGEVTYTHDGTENFSDTFTYTVRDAAGQLSNVATVTVTITPVNDPPTAVDDPGAAVNEGAAVVIPVLANDTDPDDGIDVTSVVATNGTFGTTSVNATTGEVTYTHDGTENFSDTFTYTVRDAAGQLSNIATVTVTITPVNDPPTAVDDPGAAVNEGAAVVIPVLANDTDPDDGLDVTSVVATNGTFGTTSVNATTGEVTYTHDGTENFSDTFTYTVEDAAGQLSNVATVTVTITPVNDPPTAVDDPDSGTITVAEGSLVGITVLGNDTDPDDGIDVTSVVATNGTFGTTSVNGTTGEVTYTHDGTENFSDTFTYLVRDVAGQLSNAATVTITITPVNDPPTAVDDPGAAVNEGAAVVIPVLANDTDPDDGLDVTSVVATNGTFGTTSVNATTGEVTYTHDGTENFSDTFTYTVEDAAGQLSNTATVTITITPVNDPPVAVDDAAGTLEDTSVIINVVSNDSDVEDVTVDPTSVVVVSGPSNGLVIDNNDGTVTYEPDFDFNGSDSFTYTVDDSNAATSNIATVTLTVTAVNDAPRFDLGPNQSHVVSPGPQSFPGFYTNESPGPANESGQTPLILTVINDNPALFSTAPAINQATGELTYTPAVGVSGTAIVTVTLQDPGGQANGGDDTLEKTFGIGVGVFTISKVADVGTGPVLPGSDITYTVQVENNDTVTHTNISVTDPPPTGTTWQSTTLVTPALFSVGDNFDAVAYTNQDGTANWASPWTETNDDGNPASGRILIADDPAAGTEFALVVAGTTRSIERSVDLSLASSAVLSFDYMPDRLNSSSDFVWVDVWDGSTWTEIHEFHEIPKQLVYFPFSIDISDYANAATRIRFRTGGQTTDHGIHVNNLAISYAQPGTPTAGTAGPTHLSGLTLRPGDTATVTMTVTIDDPPTTAPIVNTATVASDQSPALNASATTNLTNRVPVANDDGPYVVAEGGTLNEPAASGVLANDTDPDVPFDTLTASLVSGPSQATAFTLNPDGSFTYTHNGSETVTDTFTYTTSDGTNTSAAATVTITITPVNDPPTAVDDPGAAVNEGAAVVIPVLANDTDPDDGLDVTSVVATNGTFGTTSVNGTTGEVTYTHDGTENFSDTFTYTVRDTAGQLSNVATVTVTITPVNDPPTAVDDPDSGTITVAEGASIGINVLANDTDPDDGIDVTTVVATNGTFGTTSVNATTGEVTYTHDGTENFSDTFTYTVQDAAGQLSNIATVTITITPVNDPPTAVDDPTSGTIGVSEGGSVAITVLANDSDPDDGLDVTSVVATNGTFGTTSVNATTGEVTYTHDGTENFSDTFTYTVRDSAGQLSNVATVTITVSAVNDPPVAVDATFSIDEDAADADPVGTVSASDPDIGDTLSYAITSGDPDGSFAIDSSGNITVVNPPGLDYETTTSYSLSVTVTDDGTPSLSDTATITVNVGPINDNFPIGVPDSLVIDEGASGLVNVLTNDTDPDLPNDFLRTFSTGVPPHASTTTSSINGDFTYGHDDSENHSDVWFYRLEDDAGQFVIVPINITINPINDNTPVAVDDNYSLAEGGTLDTLGAGELPVLDNDSDADLPGDSLTAQLVAGPSFGTLTLNPNGHFDYTHDGSENFTDTFTYEVFDGAFTSTTATVTLTIAPVNDNFPVATDNALAVAEGGSNSVDVLTDDSDVDLPNDTLTIVSVTNGVYGTAVTDGTSVTYTHNGTENFTDTIIYTLEDAAGQQDTAIVSVTISPVNDNPPTAVDDGPYSVLEAGTIDTAADSLPPTLANDTDVDLPNDTLTAFRGMLDTGPTFGTLSFNPDGSFVYTHDGTENFTDSFTYTLSDAVGNLDRATVTIDIIAVNEGGPTAVPDGPYAVAEGATIDTVADVLPGVLANDTDPDLPTDTLVASQEPSDTGPDFGTLTLNADGSFVYTHNGSENFSDSFTYTVTDDAGNTDTTTASISISPVNDNAPVATDNSMTVAEGGANVVDVKSDDSDVDMPNDTLTVVSVTNGTFGTASTDGTSVSYTHDGTENFTDSVTYTLEDAAGQQDTAIVTITITPVNDNTPVATDNALAVAEGAANNVDVKFDDTDTDLPNDTLTVVAVTAGAHGTASTDGTSITYTHDDSENFSDSVIYTLEDAAGQQDTAVVTITINPVNDNSPVAGDDIAVGIPEGGTRNEIGTPLLNNDSDVDLPNDALTASREVADTGPTYGTVLVNPDGTYVYNHDGSENFADSFTYTVTDAVGNTDRATVTLTIVPVNDNPPVANDDSGFVVAEGGNVTGSVALNDSDLDLPNDTLTYTVVSPPTFHASFVLAADGSFDYTHFGPFEGLSDSFTYQVEDEAGNTDTATATITITPVNDNVPAAVDDGPYVLDEAGTIDTLVAGQPSVLDNDTDNDLPGDTLTASLADAPAFGSVVLDPTGHFVYTHDGSENFADSFTYEVFDGVNTSAPATVTLSINPINDSDPIATDDSLVVVEGGTAGIDVKSNDTDPDLPADSLTVVGVTDGAHGTALTDGTNVTYTHDGTENLIDSVTYTLEDAAGHQDIAVVFISVTPVNDNGPVASDDVLAVDEGATGSVDVVANDTDPDLPNDILTVVSVTNGSFGAATTDGTQITYLHDGTENFVDAITYTLEDEVGNQTTATVSISVNPVNDNPPVAVDDGPFSGAFATDISGSVLDNDSDVDGDSLAAFLDVSPEHGSVALNPDGTFVYSHDGSGFLTDSFAYRATDGLFNSTPATVAIVVEPAQPPVANPDGPITVQRASSVTGPSVLTNDTDPLGLEMIALVVDQPVNGSLILNSDGTFVYGHDGSDTTTDSFTYVARNATTSSEPATVTIVVTPLPIVPAPELIAVDDIALIDEDTGLTINILANDVRGVSTDLTVTFIGQAANGLIELGADGNVSYVPDAEWSGIEIIPYTVVNSAGQTASARLVITVQAVNDPPIASDSSGESTGDISFDLNALVTDIDNGDRGYTFLITGRPLHGTVTIQNDIAIYVPDRGFVGEDSFVYKAFDGSFAADSGTISVFINPLDQSFLLTTLSPDLGREYGERPPPSPGTTSDIPSLGSLNGVRLLFGEIFGHGDVVRMPLLAILGVFIASLVIGLRSGFTLAGGALFLPPISPNLHAVVLKDEDEMLLVFEGPGEKFGVIHRFPPTERGIQSTGRTAEADGFLWMEVETPEGDGWVSTDHLTIDVTPGAFASDDRVANLMEQAKHAFATGSGLNELIAPRGLFVAHFAEPVRFENNDVERLLENDLAWRFWDSPDDATVLSGNFTSRIAAPLAHVMNSDGETSATDGVEMSSKFENFNRMTYTNPITKAVWSILIDVTPDGPLICGIWRVGEINPNSLAEAS